MLSTSSNVLSAYSVYFLTHFCVYALSMLERSSCLKLTTSRNYQPTICFETFSLAGCFSFSRNPVHCSYSRKEKEPVCLPAGWLLLMLKVGSGQAACHVSSHLSQNNDHAKVNPWETLRYAFMTWSHGSPAPRACRRVLLVEKEFQLYSLKNTTFAFAISHVSQVISGCYLIFRKYFRAQNSRR